MNTGETASIVIQDQVLSPSRLRAVLESALLDTGPEAAFDDLTRLAAVLIDAPFAFATIVDDARSFWKSTFGIPAGVPHQNTVSESFCQYVVRSGTELIVADTTANELVRDNPSVKSMGVRAWAGFPLLAPDGEVLGSFCVVDTKTRDWTERDRQVLQTLAAAAAREIALRGAVVEERLARARAEALAKTLQETLMPPLLPAVPGLEIAPLFHPAGTGVEVAGDFYDFFQITANRWGFVLGDVCGKGVEAAKIAALARHAVGVAGLRVEDAGEVLSWVNETLLTHTAEKEFLTAIYGTIERRESASFRVRLACAGHIPPILRRASGETTTIELRGPLVGQWKEFSAPEMEFELHPGDALVLYTDGISEARHKGRIFGEEPVKELVASAHPQATARAIAERLANAALDHCARVASDDIAVIVLRVP